LAGIAVAQKWLRQNSGVIPPLEQVTHTHQAIFEGVRRRRSAPSRKAERTRSRAT
jgi:hypothetical protein